jgi:hypothetical protein
MSETPNAKEKPVNDTGGGNAPEAGSPTTTEEEETAGTTEGSD